MQLELTSDQQFFVETTRKFLDDKAPVALLRSLRNDPIGFPRDLWTQGAQLGWTSLLVSEVHGGGSMSGQPVGDLALVAYEFGTHAAPSPLIPTSVVAGALSRSGSAEQNSGVLAGLLSGETIATWASAEPRPNKLGDVTTTIEQTAKGFRLNGTKSPVESANAADHLLVTARSADGLTQVLVPTSTAGVTIKAMKGIDVTRRFSTVRFENVELPATAVVGSVGGAAADIDWQLRATIALELQQMVGSMHKAMQITVEWSFDRYSFGRPIASYQALKHKFADMKGWLESSHAIADGAAQAIDDDAANAWEMLSAGKAYVGYNGTEVMHGCVQMHGGIGVTYEHDLHLYVRRVVLGSRLHGTVAEHRERLTTLLEEKEPAR